MFASFLDEVHGSCADVGPRGPRDPFPWQQALLERVVTDGRWPDVIDVPTGLGKTSVLDVAVFAAALGVPCARRRVFYVVDRRLVVDEAYEHAQRLANALSSPNGRPITALVAQRIAVAGNPTVLTATRMRGGTTWEWNWLQRPDQYAIVTATVDQVGSRLLFRGYGISDRLRSIDAALVGTDSLVIVDEAHLAQAFTTTVNAALTADTGDIAPRPILVTMSATSTRDDGRTVHRISRADYAHPVAGRRLLAPKRLSLVQVKTVKANADRDMAAAMAKIATAHTGVVGVVANTVSRARAIFDRLDDTVDKVLLTGRSRPIDRDFLLHNYYPKMRVGRDRSAQTPLVVVATQTVEVGANIDFDALVTESAPLPSLIQRLGRLNRTADSDNAPNPVYLVHDSTVTTNDAVYGPARLTTWNWLSQHTPIHRYNPNTPVPDPADALDACPAALRELVDQCPADDLAAMQVPQPYVPVLTPSILDCWARTSPTPVPDQPIEPFLHGVQESSAPVTVVWRDGLPPDANKWATLIDVLPPSAEESIDVPIAAVRQWLTDRTAATATDLDTTADQPTSPHDTSEPAPHVVPRVLRYQGRGDAEAIHPARIRPGDTIIVPSQVGGCDAYGWNPRSTTPTVDVACLAWRRKRPIIKLDATFEETIKAYQPALHDSATSLCEQATKDLDNGPPFSPDPYRNILRQMLDHLRDTNHLTTPLGAVIQTLVESLRCVSIPPDSGESDPSNTRILLTVRSGPLADDNTELGSSAAAQAIELDAHQRAVARRARQFARNLDLPDRIITSIASAARWHDEGKRDPRFQLMLWRGDRAAAELADEPLAKSGMDPTDRAAIAQARRDAGYPLGMRHEALSARIAAHRIAHKPTLDPDLVIHLVASHHGHARPLLPPITDPAPAQIELDTLGTIDTAQTIDWGHPQRFAHLNSTYGRWGLALLETVVRLADIWVSARNERSDEPIQEP